MNKFQKLYDFKQKIGNEWYYNYDYNIDNDSKIDTVKFKLYNIQNTTINGQVLKKYGFFRDYSIFNKGKLCRNIFSFIPESDRGKIFFTEKIGFDIFLIGTENAMLFQETDVGVCYTDKYLKYYHTTLNCYQDSAFGLYKSSYIIKDCNTIDRNPFTSTGINTESIAQAVTISPNPSFGIFTIAAGSYQNINISVTDVLGNEVYHTQSNASNTEINLQQMPKGIYFVRIAAKDKAASHHKVVLQ